MQQQQQTVLCAVALVWVTEFRDWSRIERANGGGREEESGFKTEGGEKDLTKVKMGASVPIAGGHSVKKRRFS